MVALTIHEKRLSQFASEIGLTFTFSFFYFILLVESAKLSLLFETSLCLLLPLIIHVYNRTKSKTIHQRVIQLLLIESSFMFFSVLGKLFIRHHWQQANQLLGYGFVSLFVLQFSFFMLYQYKVKSTFGFIRTAMFLLLLPHWFYHAPMVGTLGWDGGFLFTGVKAPTYIVAYYCFWVIGIPLVDSKTLPNFLTAALHFASVLVALFSGEFFHARLLTASHLFVLDYLFGYSSPYNKTFGMLSEKWFDRYQKKGKPLIDWLTLIACGVIFISVTLLA